MITPEEMARHIKNVAPTEFSGAQTQSPQRVEECLAGMCDDMSRAPRGKSR